MTALGLLLIMIFIVAYFRKRATRAQDEVDARFWERETLANSTRKQDLSDLPYITIPLDKFPIGIYPEQEIKEAEELLVSLSSQKILNLENSSNTDLKLQYGAANLDFLSECDENFASLCRTLVAYAEALYRSEHPAEAQTVLEFGISCGSDASRNYILLGEIYQEQQMFSQLEELTETARSLSSPMRVSIVNHLEELSASSGSLP
jgi:hypothetical protein